MYENYVATQYDLDTLQEGISYVWKSELDFIFKDRTKLESVRAVSFDSKNIFIFQFGKDTITIPHNIKLTDDVQYGWQSNLGLKDLLDYLPENLKNTTRSEVPIISGPLVTPMSKLQDNSIYNTKESYLATIVHEFAHIYFNEHEIGWFSNKENNIEIMESAINLYKGDKEVTKSNVQNLQIHIPHHISLGEIFSFCVDYSAASIFWPNHKMDIDKSNIKILNYYKGEENKLDFDQEASYFEQDSHIAASAIGKIILEKYPMEWKNKLLQPFII